MYNKHVCENCVWAMGVRLRVGGGCCRLGRGLCPVVNKGCIFSKNDSV